MELNKTKYYDFKNSTAFPHIDNGIVASAEFETCKDNKLLLKIVKITSDEIENGFVKKAWWIVQTPHLPNRYVYLY